MTDCATNPGLSAGIIMLPISLSIFQILRYGAGKIRFIITLLAAIGFIISCYLVINFGFINVPQGDRIYYATSSIMTIINALILFVLIYINLKKLDEGLETNR